MANRLARTQKRPTSCPKCKALLQRKAVGEDPADSRSRRIFFLKCPNFGARKPLVKMVHHPVTGELVERFVRLEDKVKGRDIICNWVDPLYMAHLRENR